MSYIYRESIKKSADFISSAVGMVLKTYGISESQDYIEDGCGSKIVKAGTPYPSDDDEAVGIVFEDVDITFGSVAGSVLVGGRVYRDRLDISDEAVSALKTRGIIFDDAPKISRAIILDTGFEVTTGCTFSAEDIAESSDGLQLEITAVSYDNAAAQVFTAQASDGNVTVTKVTSGSGVLLCTVADENGFTDVISISVNFE